AETFGTRYHDAGGGSERLALRDADARRAQFAQVDSLLDAMIAGALSGMRIAEVIDASDDDPLGGRIELQVDPGKGTKDALQTHLEIAEQERRGSWDLPEDETLSLGLIHAAYWAERNPRFLVNLADSERAHPDFRGQPEAVAVWVLEPLFEVLFLPFK